MGTENNKLGLKGHSRSPSAIANAIFHDASRSQKEISGIPGTIKSISIDDAEHAVEDFVILQVANDTGGTIFLWTGEATTNPAVTSANGIAILNGTAPLVFMGAGATNKGLAYKLSAAAQVVCFEPK